ncbi:MAG: hypothetical protein J6Y78_10920 [Paludibacteraceae bacterium]|nr:hypothetical protein [Paludibacteraceae bacterium]
MEDERIEKVVNDLYLFYRGIVAKKFTENVPAPHIQSLSKELMKMYRGDYHRLCVAMPPRHAKSSMISLAFPLWLIFHNPNLNILIINNSSELSMKFGLELREMFYEYGKYFNVYLSKLKQSQTFFKFCDSDEKLYNGSVRLVGASGSITGHDADYIIVDDPYKGLAEELTPTALQKKVDWYNIIVEQRIEPHTRIVILHTRWHSQDIQGWLKKNDAEAYKFIEYPAILEDGTPMWKQRYKIEELEKKREVMGYRMFESIYQQHPLDDDTEFFDMRKVKWYDPQITPLMSVRGWDIASADETEELNDFTAGVKMYLLPNDEVLITDLIHGKFGGNVKNEILNACYKDGMDTRVLIETGVAGAGKLLFAEYSEVLKPYIVEQALPVTSKVDRATPLANAVLDGKVYISIKDEETRKLIKDEFNSFPAGVNDDIVDATAHAYNFLCRQDKGINPDILFIDL